MSEETKEMEEVVESEEVEEEAVAEAKVTKHDGEDDAKKNPNFAKDVKKAKSESKVKKRSKRGICLYIQTNTCYSSSVYTVCYRENLVKK